METHPRQGDCPVQAGKRDEAAAITKAEGATKVKEVSTAVTTLAELAEKRGVEFMNAAMVAATECQIYFIAAVAWAL